MQSRSRKFLSLIAVLAVAPGMTLTACGDGSSSAAGGGDKSITIGLPVVTSTFAPIYLAVDEGYFEEQGLKVKLVHFRGGSDLVKGVASGSVDIGVTALSGPMTAIAQGRDLKVFYGGFNMMPFQWWATPEIKSVQDAVGARWGVSKIGSSTDFLTRYLLKRNNLDPEADVKIVSGGGSAGRLAAQEEGQLKVNIFSVPETFQAEQKGYTKIADQAELMDGYPFHVSFAQQSFLEDNPDTAEAFLRGLVKGMDSAKNDPQAAQDVIVKEVKIDPELAAPTYEAYIDQVFPDGRLPSKEAMDVFWEIGIDNGQFKEQIPESEWLDRRWMDSYPEWTK